MLTLALLFRRRRSGPANPVDRVLDAAALARQRRHLSELDSHLLRDIGLDRDAVEREISRSVWDVPTHWRRG